MPTPAKAKQLFTNDVFEFVGLGGHNEVGRNCFAAKHHATGKIAVLDVGAFFCEDFDLSELYAEDLFGDAFRVSDYLPDFSYLQDDLHEIEAVFISHAHFDHLLGLIKLWRMCQRIGKRFTIITSRFAYYVILRLFNQAGINPPEESDFVFLNQTNREIQAGPFTFYPCQMVHSTPQSFGTGVSMDGQGFFYAGDFKWQACKGDKVINTGKVKRRLQEIAQTFEIQLIACEALYCDRPGMTDAEDKVWKGFKEILDQHKDQHIAVTFFASHADRLENCLKLGEEHGLKADFYGRSMLGTIEAGRQIGLRLPKHDPAECRLHFVTGPQGEPGSITKRMSQGQKFGFETDVLVVMSEAIPGYEYNLCEMLIAIHYHFETIYVTTRVWQALLEHVRREYGSRDADFARMLLEGDEDYWQPGLKNRVVATNGIHVSGHGSVEDIKEFLRQLVPFQKTLPEIIPYHIPDAKRPAWRKLLKKFLSESEVKS